MSQSGDISYKYELEGSPARFANFLAEGPKASGCWKFKVSSAAGEDKVCRVTAEQFTSKWGFALHVICHPLQWSDWGRAWLRNKDIHHYLEGKETKTRIMADPPIDRLNQIAKESNWGVLSIPNKGIAIFSSPFLPKLGALTTSLQLTLMARCDPEFQGTTPNWERLEEALKYSIKGTYTPKKPEPLLRFDKDTKTLTLSLPSSYLAAFSKIDPKLRFLGPDAQGMVRASIVLEDKKTFLERMDQWGLLNTSSEGTPPGSEGWWTVVLHPIFP